MSTHTQGRLAALDTSNTHKLNSGNRGVHGFLCFAVAVPGAGLEKVDVEMGSEL